MKRVEVYFTLIILFILSSCQSDDSNVLSPPPAPTSNLDFLPGNTGSTWIYGIYQVDTNGTEVFLGNDTMTVFDSIIHSTTYKAYSYKSFPIQTRIDHTLMRDSSGFMVNESGKVVFTVQLLDSVIRRDNKGGLLFSYTMEKNSNPRTVPAGTYTDLLNYKTIFSYDSSITVPVFLPKERIFHKVYAKNVGLIFETYAFVSRRDQQFYERRLLSYTIIP